jgi:glycosyltransferase involved in cell wall biosynthesis
MKRDIVINGRFLSRRITGVERYGREISQLFGSSYRVEKTRGNRLAGHAWEQFVLPTKLKSNSILWSPANTGPIMVHNQALTIHDLSPLEHPEWFNKDFAAWYRLFLPPLAKRVQIIFTPSEYTKQKVMKRFGIANVLVTPNGVDTSVFHPNAKQNTVEFPKKYILFVGSIQPRKNLDGLMQAWHEIKNEFKDTWLVVAGEAGHIFRAVKFLADERIRFLNYVSEDVLPGLYAGAELFVLPSFDEGFGLPVLEAMSCGTPVIVSNGGALPEIVDGAGLVFELSNPNGLANAIRECLNDNDLRLSLKEKGFCQVKSFSWKKTAELIWNTLNEI